MSPENNNPSAVISEVMELLCEIPQGGVGANGSTMEEIEQAERDGHNVENDAVYHVVQKAWLLLDGVRDAH